MEPIETKAAWETARGAWIAGRELGGRALRGIWPVLRSLVRFAWRTATAILRAVVRFALRLPGMVFRAALMMFGRHPGGVAVALAIGLGFTGWMVDQLANLAGAGLRRAEQLTAPAKPPRPAKPAPRSKVDIENEAAARAIEREEAAIRNQAVSDFFHGKKERKEK